MLTAETVDAIEHLVRLVDTNDNISYDTYQSAALVRAELPHLRRLASLPAELRSESIRTRAELATKRNNKQATWDQIDAGRERADLYDWFASRIEGCR